MRTTVQDLGRRGFLSQGVPIGGAMDPFALRVANLMVGNGENAPGLEILLSGPELEFGRDCWIAACGARFENIPAWRPLRVAAGERIRFGERIEGCRCYLAISGGIRADRVLGGAGTYLRGGFGGFHGRALRDGDVLVVADALRVPTDHWGIDERMLPKYSKEGLVRVVEGSHAADFGDNFYAGRYRVTPRSDRMGIRLEGHRLERSAAAQLLSSAVAPGTVQVPPDGDPIVLMADAQTLGGYPRAAHVVTVDLPLMAQLAPGDWMRFAKIGLAEAHGILKTQHRQLGLLRQGVAAKMRSA